MTVSKPLQGKSKRFLRTADVRSDSAALHHKQAYLNNNKTRKQQSISSDQNVVLLLPPMIEEVERRTPRNESISDSTGYDDDLSSQSESTASSDSIATDDNGLFCNEDLQRNGEQKKIGSASMASSKVESEMDPLPEEEEDDDCSLSVASSHTTVTSDYNPPMCNVFGGGSVLFIDTSLQESMISTFACVSPKSQHQQQELEVQNGEVESAESESTKMTSNTAGYNFHRSTQEYEKMSSMIADLLLL
eukprot:scaffold133_cov115-Cylindrotheca_fusiformis.AAC.7